MFNIIGKQNQTGFKLGSLAAAVAFIAGAICASGAQASTFSDDFNADTGNFSVTSSANFNNLWNVSQGSVDIIPVDGQYDYYPGNGSYVDLNGSTQQLGGLSTVQTFGPGSYSLTFNLGGSLGGAHDTDETSKTTQISLGSFITTITLAPNAGFTFQTLNFTTLTGGTLNFTSLAGGDPDIGNILDNVTLNATPLPSTWLMLLSGFLGLGFVAYVGSKKRNSRKGEHSFATV